MDRTAKEDTSGKQQILRRIYLFSGIGEADLSTLARMAVKKNFPRQATIFSEGKEGPGVFSAHHRTDKTGKEFTGGQRIHYPSGGAGREFRRGRGVRRNSLPGYGHHLRGLPHLILPQGAVFAASGRLPGVGPQHAGHLEPLDVSPDQTAGGSSLKEVSARLARYILERCHHTHGEIAAGLHCELPTTKTQLAAYLGTISETLSRTLSRFKVLGLIEVDKGKITIVDPVALHKMAQGSKS